MSRTRTRPSSSTFTARATQVQSETPEAEKGVPKCSGHQRRCQTLTAGANSKSPGRVFHCCPLDQHNSDRCNFFKWADVIDGTETRSTQRIETSRLVNGAAQTLGQSPHARFGRPIVTATPTATRPVQTAIREEDEIDWGKVDTAALEQDAIASSPSSSQNMTPHADSFAGRLRKVASSSKKRVHDEDQQGTAKRVATGDDNPFLSPIVTSPHPALSPSLGDFETLSEHLHRQDRLIRAGDAAKEGFRKTIKRLQDENELLKKKLKDFGESELEKKRVGSGL